MKPQIVVFASGSGSNFEALAEACRKNRLDAKISGLICDRNSASAIDRAVKYHIPWMVIKKADYSSQQAYVDYLLKSINRWSPDLIVLAGYLSKLPTEIIDQAGCPIINVHPSLLPEYGGKGFYGQHVHRAVIDNNESESGCSVHQVTEEFDDGPVLKQARVPVFEDDTPQTLADRIRPHEHRILIETVNQLLTESRDSSKQNST